MFYKHLQQGQAWKNSLNTYNRRKRGKRGRTVPLFPFFSVFTWFSISFLQIRPLERSEKDFVLPKRNSGSEAKRTSCSRSETRGAKRKGLRAVALAVQLPENLRFSVIPKRNSGSETREAKLGRLN
ncbi:hypothetical protein BGV40_15120 [Methanosarcina sp. Ant1]|nr:hypothetical protein BGV40_15120 [Methanosarcina sp. Ant1]